MATKPVNQAEACFAEFVCVSLRRTQQILTSELVYVGSDEFSVRNRDRPKSDTLHTRLLLTRMFRAARSR